MLGDLPPSSRASGVRLRAADAMSGAGRGRPAGEADLVDPGVADQGRARSSAPPTTTLSTPGGRPGLEGQLGEAQHAERGQLGRLGHHGVAGRQGRAALLAHAHHRAVPRRDDRDDAVGLEADVGQPAARPTSSPRRACRTSRRSSGPRPRRRHPGFMTLTGVPLSRAASSAASAPCALQQVGQRGTGPRPAWPGASAAQPGWAARAAATAASTSSAPASPTWAWTSPGGRVAVVVGAGRRRSPSTRRRSGGPGRPGALDGPDAVGRPHGTT